MSCLNRFNKTNRRVQTTMSVNHSLYTVLSRALIRDYAPAQLCVGSLNICRAQQAGMNLLVFL